MSIRLDEESARWLEGVSDLHVYALPSVYLRPFDEIELAKQARAVGYRALLSKRHHCVNADAAYLVRKVVPGIDFFGGVVLNWTVGGLNPIAVDSAIKLGAKEVWMPNIHAGRMSSNPLKGDIYRPILPEHLKNEPWATTKEHKPINITTPDGDIVPEVFEILDLVADADIILGTGHISKQETFALVKAAKSSGVKKILITHPAVVPPKKSIATVFYTIEEMRKLTAMGAILEFNANNICGLDHSVEQTCAEAIEGVGADKCVLASGCGSVRSIHPIESMRYFIRSMSLYGISTEELDIMTKDTPAKLLGL